MTRRPGVSMTELIVALGIFSILMATSLGFYHQQGKAFTEGNERMTLMQNLRYGVNALEQSLRTAGIGVPFKQPVVVYAGEETFAFNADYASNLESDFFAVYRDPSLPAAAVNALVPGRKITIAGTTFGYPDAGYTDGPGNSPAETITFHFGLDQTTARLDDYTLIRQVNDQPREIIARGLLKTAEPFFTYFTLYDDGVGSNVTEVPSSSMPLAHTVPVHGAPGDTGAVAGTDSIRAVRVAYAATNGYEGDRETRREISRLIRLPNAVMTALRSCGNKPFLGVSLAAVGVNTTSATAGHVLLSWNRAQDEYTGEQDVIRYVIWRQKETETLWGDPLVSIPPGATSYSYQDFSAVVNQKYRYALAAQDCTPQYSTLSVSGIVQYTP